MVEVVLLVMEDKKYIRFVQCPPVVEVTKPIFSVPLFSQFFIVLQILVSHGLSRSYLADLVTT